ncbi:hypothetical protein PEP31012_02180 [Pandoraea eparura]|uniref:Uncharacterized protein n=1 Tax=Pandoraea eparura TaxID=2508291 RepID=A0A5E4US05_9BURK|nr:hypothetical protein PEP31012_02180 [Pandoraea eparura]
MPQRFAGSAWLHIVYKIQPSLRRTLNTIATR